MVSDSVFDRKLRPKLIFTIDPRLQSAISDIEVEHVDISQKTKMAVPGVSRPVEVGLIYDVAYKVLEEEGFHFCFGLLCRYSHQNVSFS
jgi:valyl-tRNA synthetase